MADATEGNSSASSTQPVASQVPFTHICVLLEKIRNAQGTEKKKKILKTFVDSWRDTHKSLYGSAETVSIKTRVFWFLVSDRVLD